MLIIQTLSLPENPNLDHAPEITSGIAGAWAHWRSPTCPRQRPFCVQSTVHSLTFLAGVYSLRASSVGGCYKSTVCCVRKIIRGIPALTSPSYPEPWKERVADRRSKQPEAPRKMRSWKELLGGSWVVTSRVISRVTILITHIRGLITPLITTHEPPSISSQELSGSRFMHGPKQTLGCLPQTTNYTKPP